MSAIGQTIAGGVPGVASGATEGGMVGGPWGALAGGLIGAVPTILSAITGKSAGGVTPGGATPGLASLPGLIGGQQLQGGVGSIDPSTGGFPTPYTGGAPPQMVNPSPTQSAGAGGLAALGMSLPQLAALSRPATVAPVAGPQAPKPVLPTSNAFVDNFYQRYVAG